MLLSMEIENNLKQIRKSRKITQGDLAERVGKSLRFIQFLEKGEKDFTRKTLIDLARELDCSPADILPDFSPDDELYTKIKELTDTHLEKVTSMIDDYLALQKLQDEDR